MEQIDLFTMAEQEMQQDEYDRIYNKLSHYGIDESCVAKFKGTSPTIGETSRYLQSLPNYDDYLRDLIQELKKRLPIHDCNFRECEENHLRVLKGADTYSKIGYHCFFENQQPKEMTAPIMLLYLLPKELFTTKKEKNK